VKPKSFIASFIVLAVLIFPAASSGIREDLHESFKDEDIGFLDPGTGMSPGIPGKEESLLGSPGEDGFVQTEVAGRWTLTLTDTAVKRVDMTLFQYGNVAFGSGTLTESSSVREITAAGSLSDDVLELRLVTVGGDSMYELESVVSGTSISGIYNAYSVGKTPWTGTYYGTKYGSYAPSSFGSTSSSGSNVPITIGGMKKSSGLGMG